MRVRRGAEGGALSSLDTEEEPPVYAHKLGSTEVRLIDSDAVGQG